MGKDSTAEGEVVMAKVNLIFGGRESNKRPIVTRQKHYYGLYFGHRLADLRRLQRSCCCFCNLFPSSEDASLDEQSLLYEWHLYGLQFDVVHASKTVQNNGCNTFLQHKKLNLVRLDYYQNVEVRK